MRSRQGSRVVFKNDLRRWSFADIRRGDAATISDVDPDTGDMLLTLERYHPGLTCWKNRIPLEAADRGLIQSPLGFRGAAATVILGLLCVVGGQLVGGSRPQALGIENVLECPPYRSHA